MIQKALTVNSQLFACGLPNIYFNLFMLATLTVFAQEIKIDANNSLKRHINLLQGRKEYKIFPSHI